MEERKQRIVIVLVIFHVFDGLENLWLCLQERFVRFEEVVSVVVLLGISIVLGFGLSCLL